MKQCTKVSRWVSRAAMLLAALALMAGAQAQTAITISIGDGIGNPGDTVEIPVFLTAGSSAPTVILLFLAYDPDKLAPYPDYYEFTLTDLQGKPVVDDNGNAVVRTSPVRPEQALLDADKLVETGILPDGVPTGNLPAGVFSIGILGFDPQQQPIPEGRILTIAFKVLEGATNGETLDIAGVGADDPVLVAGEDGLGNPILEEAHSTASTSTANALTVNLVDGMVEVGCSPAETPANVQASQDRSDGVRVTWNAIAAPGAEYRVYRSTLADPNTATPLGDAWQTGLSFLDITAAVPIGGGLGCAGGEAIFTEYYYWVKARTAGTGCESDFQALGTLGFRTGGKRLATGPAPRGANADLVVLLLLAGALAARRIPRNLAVPVSRIR